MPNRIQKVIFTAGVVTSSLNTPVFLKDKYIQQDDLPSEIYIEFPFKNDPIAIQGSATIASGMSLSIYPKK